MLTVNFECIKAGSKLRIRITSQGYSNEANCQFPRSIRAEGLLYTAPASAVTMARGPAGKFFYRVKPSAITVLDPEDIVEVAGVAPRVEKIYGDDGESCAVCLDDPCSVVIVPCGHYCLCLDCANRVEDKCPMCRGRIEVVVTRDQIQTD